MSSLINLLKKNILYIGWAQALIATGGSLFFSEIMKYPPCVLCWYQRIAIYPMVILFAVAIYRKSRDIYYYALPLLGFGLLVSIFHNLLYYKIIPEAVSPCAQGISCTTKFIEYWGFVTIPFLSLCAIVVMIVCLTIHQRDTKKEELASSTND
jgi:disulfide bond formation protein DsbB